MVMSLVSSKKYLVMGGIKGYCRVGMFFRFCVGEINCYFFCYCFLFVRFFLEKVIRALYKLF